MQLPRTGTLSSSCNCPLFSVEIEGDLGDTVFLLGGGTFAFKPGTLLSGILQIDGSSGRRRIRSLPPAGSVTVTLMAPPVPQGEVLGLPLQMAFLRPTGEIRFAPASVVDVRGAGVPVW